MRARSIASAPFWLLFAAAGAAAAAAAPQSVNAELQDPSTDPTIPHMRIVLDHPSVKPGRIELHAHNGSKNLVHELIVVRDDGKALPVDAKAGVVDEHKIHSLGEVPELEPDKSGVLALTLRAGRYLLFCNQPGHYSDGMFTTLTVAP
jgi:uncharacterized cupredoxin-like copper-binding protein